MFPFRGIDCSMFWMLNSTAGSLSWSADWRLRSAPWRWSRGWRLTSSSCSWIGVLSVHPVVEVGVEVIELVHLTGSDCLLSIDTDNEDTAHEWSVGVSSTDRVLARPGALSVSISLMTKYTKGEVTGFVAWYGDCSVSFLSSHCSTGTVLSPSVGGAAILLLLLLHASQGGWTDWLTVWLLSRHPAVLQHAGELKDERGRGDELLEVIVNALHSIYRALTTSTGNRLRLAVSNHVQCDEHSTQLLGREDVEWRRGGAGLLPALRRQTAWWGTRWLSPWPGEVMLFPSRVGVQDYHVDLVALALVGDWLVSSGSGNQSVVDELGDGGVEVTSYRLHGKRSSLSTLPPPVLCD